MNKFIFNGFSSEAQGYSHIHRLKGLVFFFMTCDICAMSKKICVLYTGGTYGSTLTKDGLEPFPHGDFEQVMRTIMEENKVQTDFDFIEMKQLIDSSQAELSDWSAVAKTIADSYDEYSGFVVIHGTDTLAHASAALSFMLDGMDKPVIVTGSHYPLIAVDTDAVNNTKLALKAAENNNLKGVFVAFGDHVMAGSRVVKYSCDDVNAFHSPNAAPVSLSKGMDLRQNSSKTFSYLPIKAHDVELVRSQPGNSKFLAKRISHSHAEAIVIDAYGNGNLPDTKDMRAALKKQIERGVPVIIKTQCLQGFADFRYSAGSWLKDLGVISAHDMGEPAIMMKLNKLLDQGLSGGDLAKAFETDSFGEVQLQSEPSYPAMRREFL